MPIQMQPLESYQESWAIPAYSQLSTRQAASQLVASHLDLKHAHISGCVARDPLGLPVVVHPGNNLQLQVGVGWPVSPLKLSGFQAAS
jgi:hypothetical protein